MVKIIITVNDRDQAKHITDCLENAEEEMILDFPFNVEILDRVNDNKKGKG